MPRTTVVLFREDDGAVPLLDWLETLVPRAKAKCLDSLGRLKELGFELRRPEADILRDGIYELRVSLHRVQYRMLYFFHGNIAAVVSHGVIKEQVVPPKEIERALARKRRFLANPKRHAYKGI